MAKKSKTQRAKASAKRAEKKQQAAVAEVTPVVEEQPKKKFSLGKKTSSQDAKKAPAQQPKKTAAKPKKKRFGFLADVRSEMRRVTWPTKQDVLQWSGVVVVALIFFGLFVVILDDWVVTPILLAISSLSGLGG